MNNERIVLKMAKYRMVYTDFWMDPLVSEEMTSEERYFFLYLLTNPHTKQIGIYKIMKKQMAFDMGVSIETIDALMNRMCGYYQLIRYNPETRELAIKNWGKYNLSKGGKPVLDCILSELKEVKDTSLIRYVMEQIEKVEILAIFNSFIAKAIEDDPTTSESLHRSDNPVNESFDDTLPTRSTIRGQKENKKENKKEKQQQQEEVYLMIENEQEDESCIHTDQKNEVVNEIMECSKRNGFDYSSVNVKEQLVYWLGDSLFVHPKEIVLKALDIACAKNNRRWSYVLGILKNWERELLLTVKEVHLHNEKKSVSERRQSALKLQTGRDVPAEFELDLTAGED